MAKITLTNLANLQNETTAVNAINANNAAIETAMENTLSRDGTSPNQMGATLDMNSYQIINLPQPATANSPLRFQDLDDFVGGGTVTNIPVGGVTGAPLIKTSNSDYLVGWSTARFNTTSGFNSLHLHGSIASNNYAISADNTGVDKGLYISRPANGQMHFKEGIGSDQLTLYPANIQAPLGLATFSVPINITAINPISTTLSGGVPARTSFLLANTTNAGGNNQVGMVLDMVNNQAGNNFPLFAGVRAGVGSVNSFALNLITEVQLGNTTAPGNWIAELDGSNNSGADFGNTAGYGGLATPLFWGLNLTGAGTNNLTSAFIISYGGSPRWNRGITFDKSSTIQADIETYSTSLTSYSDRGVRNSTLDFTNATRPIAWSGATTYAIGNAITSGGNIYASIQNGNLNNVPPNTTWWSLVGSTSGLTAGWARTANNDPLLARNAASTADISLLKLDASNVINIYGTAITLTSSGSATFGAGGTGAVGIGTAFTANAWLSLPASTTTAAHINFTSGVSPSSNFVNGDFWFDGTNYSARIGGVTKNFAIPLGTLVIASGKTATINNTLTFAGTDSTTLTFQGTDTYIGRTTTDTLTNKTYDTAGTGNSFSINSVAVTANTGTGAVARAASPTFTTPTLGAATATSINNLTITSSTGTLTIAAAKVLTASNTLTLAGTDSTTITFQGTDTYVGRTTTDTLTNKTLTSPSIATPTITTSAVIPLIGPPSNSPTAIKITKADLATAVMTFDTTNARVGINKNPGASFDLDVNGTTNTGSISGYYIAGQQILTTASNFLIVGGVTGTVGTITLAGNDTINSNTSTFNFRSVDTGTTYGILTATKMSAGAATAIPAGGTAGNGYTFSSTSNFGVFFGSGAPSLAAAKGSLYLRSDGTGTADRAYINTNGLTTWTNLVTAA